MKAYRIVWTVAVGVLVARGVLLGFEHHPALAGTALLLGAATSPGFLAAMERWLGSPDESSAVDAIVRGLAHATPVYVPSPRRGELTDEQLWDLIDAGVVSSGDTVRPLDP